MPGIEIPRNLTTRCWLGSCVAAFCLTTLTTLAFPSFAAAATNTYTFAVVPQFEQRKLFAIWKPIVDEVAQRSGLSLKLVATLSVPEFEHGIGQMAHSISSMRTPITS